MVETSSVQQQNWLDLPTEVFEVILKKLAYSVGEIVRLKAVCHSWYKAANSYISSSPFYSPSSQTPWMMIYMKDEDEDINSCSFFSPEENKIYKVKHNYFTKAGNFHHDDSKSYHVVGSSYGWLVIFDPIRYNLILFNPCTKLEILLPSIKNLFPNPDDQFCCCRASLSSDPSRTQSWRVVVSVAYAYARKFAIYTHGNTNTTTWTEFGYLSSYERILWHNDKLYALVYGGSSVDVWEFENSVPMKVASLGNKHEIENLPENISPSEYYLVESLEDVFLVVHAIENRPPESPSHFYVYRLDYCGKKWEKVESLGDRILFLNRYGSTMSISASNSFKCQENSIYLENSYSWLGMDIMTVSIYNLEEKVAKPFFSQPIDMRYANRPVYWIVPNPMPPSAAAVAGGEYVHRGL